MRVRLERKYTPYLELLEIIERRVVPVFVFRCPPDLEAFEYLRSHTRTLKKWGHSSHWKGESYVWVKGRVVRFEYTNDSRVQLSLTDAGW